MPNTHPAQRRPSSSKKRPAAWYRDIFSITKGPSIYLYTPPNMSSIRAVSVEPMYSAFQILPPAPLPALPTTILIYDASWHMVVTNFYVDLG